ncbi:MAG: histidine kinase [Reichenbachiella sp.]
MASFIEKCLPILPEQGEVTVKNILISFGIVPLLGSLFISSLFCSSCLSDEDYARYGISVLISYMYWVILGSGNSYISYYLDLKLDWFEKPIQKLIIGVLITTGFTLIVVVMMNYLIIQYFQGGEFIEQLLGGELTKTFKVTLIITLSVSMFFHARGFLFSWRETAIQNEKLKNESLSSKLESLKSQVNPHFLFNSLNALTSLVYDDQAKAVDFIHQLSDVYRYVLKNRENELVPLKDEVDFIQSFISLNKIRFGDNFEVAYKGLERIEDNWMIPPLALQMLVENCIKHNEISKEKNLIISIGLVEDEISISNNINPLKVEKRDSNGLGLSNIKSRYSYLTDRELKIEEGKTNFEVVLPLLKIKPS